MGVVLPQFFFTVAAAVGQSAGIGFVTPAPDPSFDIVHAGIHTTPPLDMARGPNPIRHVGIGIGINAGCPDVADKLFELLHLGIPTGEV